MKTTIALAAAAALLFVSTAQAADAGIAATIRKFGDAFNKGDVNAARAQLTAAPAIVDEPSPHLWTGPKSLDRWLADLAKSDSAQGITSGVVAIRPATREEVSGDNAYVIVPATYTYKQKGATLRETAQLTLVMSRQRSGWKIAAWTWTGPRGVPVK